MKLVIKKNNERKVGIIESLSENSSCLFRFEVLFFILCEEIRAPVSQVEEGEHHWEYDAGDDVDPLTAGRELREPAATAVSSGLGQMNLAGLCLVPGPTAPHATVMAGHQRLLRDRTQTQHHRQMIISYIYERMILASRIIQLQS